MDFLNKPCSCNSLFLNWFNNNLKKLVPFLKKLSSCGKVSCRFPRYELNQTLRFSLEGTIQFVSKFLILLPILILLQSQTQTSRFNFFFKGRSHQTLEFKSEIRLRKSGLGFLGPRPNWALILLIQWPFPSTSNSAGAGFTMIVDGDFFSTAVMFLSHRCL